MYLRNLKKYKKLRSSKAKYNDNVYTSKKYNSFFYSDAFMSYVIYSDATRVDTSRYFLLSTLIYLFDRKCRCRASKICLLRLLFVTHAVFNDALTRLLLCSEYCRCLLVLKLSKGMFGMYGSLL